MNLAKLLRRTLNRALVPQGYAHIRERLAALKPKRQTNIKVRPETSRRARNFK